MPANPQKHAHELVDQLAPAQLAAVVHLLEVMIEEKEDELTAEDREAIRTSRDYFQRNPDGGLSLDEVAAGCGLSVDQIRNSD